MKKFLLFLMMTSIAEGILAQAFSGGAGTSDDPYQIDTTADLIYLSQHSVDWNKHFLQTANIIFDANWYEAANWSPAVIPDTNLQALITADNQPANYPVINSNASVRNLTINIPQENAITNDPGGSLTIQGKYISGPGTAIKINGPVLTQQ